MKIEKYFDMTEYGAAHDVRRYISDGWKVIHQGLTLVIMELEVEENEK